MQKGAVGVLLVLWTCLCAAAADASPNQLRAADFLASDTAIPPGPGAGPWERRALPDDWSLHPLRMGNRGWYRYEMTLAERPSQSWAVLLSRCWMNATVYVNGRPIAGRNEFGQPIANNWNRPLFAVVPGDAWRVGVNEIAIGVWAPNGAHGGLISAEVGPEAELRPRFQQLYAVNATLNEVVLACTLLMSAFMSFLWLRRRQDGVNGWFALSCLFWAAEPFLFLVRDFHEDTALWVWAANVVNYWVAVATAIMIQRYFGIRRARLERGLLGYAIAATLLLPLFDRMQWSLGPTVLEAGAFVTTAYALVLAVTRAHASRRSDEVVLAIGVVWLDAVALHDAFLDMGVLSRQDWYWTHYGSPLFCLVVAWLLTGRFVQALRHSEALSSDLARRVEEKHRELEATYRRMESLQRQQAVAEERERIMRDLHDGLGGQLVSALALSQGSSASPAMQATLRDALDDLRNVIDSLDPTDGDLLMLLGTVRGRLEPRLSEQGLRFDWQVEDIPSIAGFGPDKALQVLRILQEAIGNIVKHARATTITIRTGVGDAPAGSPASVFVEVGDDGVGLRPSAGSGRGLRNMQERARRIGAIVDVKSEARGTIVRLLLPLTTG